MDRDERVRSLFERATAVDAVKRLDFLVQACGEDRELYRQVERLLVAFEPTRSPHDRTTQLGGAVDTPVRATQAFGLSGVIDERFEIGAHLGTGGFGQVYEAFDRQTGDRVAVKALRFSVAEDLYRFKREFRALVDIRHPNLVRLHELFVRPDRSFFTMELITGWHFWRQPSADRWLDPRASTREEIETVQSLVLQLVEGVNRLHSAGIVHCDLKPSNVLVTGDGRVVVVDFGILSQIGNDEATASDVASGTPTYMAPETAARGTTTPASDWYALGVMLYITLVGRPPFVGTATSILHQKVEGAAPGLPSSAHQIGPQLAELSSALLARDPERRPKYAEICSHLEVTGRGRSRSTLTSVAASSLIDRSTYLSTLCEAVVMPADRGRLICLHGEPGVGKSTILREFVTRLAAEGDALTLMSRCFQRESVPYNALDGAIDALSHWMKQQPLSTVRAVIPPDSGPLLALFPVLGRVAAFAADQPVPSGDALDARRRALGALRELLARLAGLAPLVLIVDDAQWGDQESANLLLDLLAPPDAPAVSLLLTYRSAEAPESPFLQRLLSASAAMAAPRFVEVTPLSPVETLALARRQVRDPRAAEVVARESAGNPFLLGALSRYVASDRFASNQSLSIRTVVLETMSELPSGGRRLIETLAVAACPIGWEVACVASEVSGERGLTIRALRDAQLVREAATPGGPTVETYHDRIREVVAAALSPERTAEVHGHLARALERFGSHDAEALSVHFAGAGDLAKATQCAREAARHAASSFAFDRSARLLRDALRWTPPDSDLSETLHEELGDVLSAAGRGSAAADEYLAAAPRRSGWGRVDLERRAAEQLLVSGHIERGREVVRSVLRHVGMRLPRTRTGMVAALLLRRAILTMRGLRYTPRVASTLLHDRTLVVDTCWSMAKGLSLVDTIGGSAFQARHLLLALQLGEPSRVLRALVLEVGHRGLKGRAVEREVTDLLTSIERQAKQLEDPYPFALTQALAGALGWLNGRWQFSFDRSEHAIELFTARCGAPAWEMTTAHVFSLAGLVFLGRYREHRTRLPQLIARARERDNLFAEASLRLLGYAHVVQLADDAPDDAEATVRAMLAAWPTTNFDLQQFWGLYAMVDIALYRGDAQLACNLVSTQASQVRWSFLLLGQTMRISWLQLQARCCVAGVAAGLPLERRARKLIRRLQRESTPVSLAFAASIGGGLAAAQGDAIAAAAYFDDASRRFDDIDMAAHAAAARLLGSALGNRVHVVETRSPDESHLTAEAVRDPRRFAAMLVAGALAG